MSWYVNYKLARRQILLFRWRFLRRECVVSLASHLFQMHDNATLLHHGILLVVVHQVGQRVEPLATTHVVLPIRLGSTRHQFVSIPPSFVA